MELAWFDPYCHRVCIYFIWLFLLIDQQSDCFDILMHFDFFLILCLRISAICIDPEKAVYGSPFLCELRVLKICSLSLSMRRTVLVYWRSLVKMRDLLLYILFAMIVISVMCLEMYMGVLTQKCVRKPLDVGNDEFWSTYTSNSGK